MDHPVLVKIRRHLEQQCMDSIGKWTGSLSGKTHGIIIICLLHKSSKISKLVNVLEHYEGLFIKVDFYTETAFFFINWYFDSLL